MQGPAGSSAPQVRPSTVGRVVAGLGAALALGYTALVPSIVFFASIGSWECLGTNCDPAQAAIVGGTVIGYLAGLTAVVLLVVLVFRPRRGVLVAAVLAIVLAALALVVQVWGVATVTSGRDRGAAAMQVAFDVDQVVQQAVADITGMSVWSTSGVTGPDVRVDVCPSDTSQFVAMSSLTFDTVTGLTEGDRDAISQGVVDSTTALMLLPGVDVTSAWTQDGSRWILTVTSSCQPVPEEDS